MVNTLAMSTSAISPEPSVSQHPKTQRVLACVLCQQRKIRCDRKFPCINCTKSRTQCVPSTLGPRQRKRRFPERELLERIRAYESLLRQNNIRFEPLHKDSYNEKKSPNVHDDSDHEQPEVQAADSPSSRTVKSEDYGAKNVFHAMSHGFRDPDNDNDSSDGFVRETDFKTAWDLVLENSDQLLFGSRNSTEAVDLSTLHPEPVHIFRLWQIYLDNVNPLLKVTHTPSLQGRIVDAISNMTNISPNLEALMFSIYCMAVLSFSPESDKCQTIFGSSQEDLLTKFRFGCHQALLNCGFLRTDDRDCLTALYLYLVSVRQCTVPPSLSSMLGIAIRIAQRMGINSESALAKCETVLEAEMRRRLWWSLVLFDTRIGEMADFKAAATLNPTWDCRIPLNVNDSDLSDMKEPPAVQARPTEALFTVVRSELGDFLRHSTYYLETTCPALKTVAKALRPNPNSEDSGSELDALEKMIEDKYLRLCDPENPIHFMTIWFARGFIAKCRLTEHHVRCFSSSGPTHQTEQQRSTATSYALRLLECDTQCTSSRLTNGFLWLGQLYFPFPAYLQIAQDLKTRPGSEGAEKAWEIMSDNYEARFASVELTGNVFIRSHWFKLYAGIILRAWDAREAAFNHQVLMPPRIISSIRHTLTQISQSSEPSEQFQPIGGVGMGINMFPAPIPTNSRSVGLLYDMARQGDYGVMPGSYTDIPPGQPPLDIDVNSIDWSAMNWGLGGTYTGDWDTRLGHL